MANKTRAKKVGENKYKVYKQKTHYAHGVKWRLSSSRTIITNKYVQIDDKGFVIRETTEFRRARKEIDEQIEIMEQWSFDQLYAKYPKQYKEHQRNNIVRSNIYESTNMSALIEKYRLYLTTIKKQSKSTIDQTIRLLKSHVKYLDFANKSALHLSPTQLNMLFMFLYKSKEELKSERDNYTNKLQNYYNKINITRQKLHERIENMTVNNRVSMSAFNRYVSVWSNFYQFLLDENHIKDHAIFNYKWSKPLIENSVDKIEFYNSNEIPLFEQELERQIYKRTPQKRALQLVLYTGCRPGEAVGISSKDLIGFVKLNAEMNKDTSNNFRHLENTYKKYILIYRSLLNVMESSGVDFDNINDEVMLQYQPDYLHMDLYQRMTFVNTLKLCYFWNTAQYYTDFNFVNYPKENHVEECDDFIAIQDINDELFSGWVMLRTIQTLYDTDGKRYYDFKDGAKTKSGTGREIALNSKARRTIVNILREYSAFKKQYPNIKEYKTKSGTKIPALLLRQSDGSITQTAHLRTILEGITNRIQKEEPEFPTISPHGLRHTFTTQTVNNRSSIQELNQVSQALGHSNISTTIDTYLHNNKFTSGDSIEDLL